MRPSPFHTLLLGLLSTSAASCGGISGDDASEGAARNGRISATEIACTESYFCGRAPEGFVAPRMARTTGELFAAYAVLEAAAVDAFERMVIELEAHGAPRGLVYEARRAANDEWRHAQLMTKHANAYGVEPPASPAAPRTVRSLLAIALENAVEGCVRETYGALVALRQSRHSENTDLRRAMRAIAADEARHAELSWKLASWLDTRLSVEERALVERARARAFARLETECAVAAWREQGSPEPSVAAAMARALASSAAALRDAAVAA